MKPQNMLFNITSAPAAVAKSATDCSVGDAFGGV